METLSIEQEKEIREWTRQIEQTRAIFSEVRDLIFEKWGTSNRQKAYKNSVAVEQWQQNHISRLEKLIFTMKNHEGE